MRNRLLVTDAWNEYQHGIDFKNQISLYKTVDENWRFFEMNSWKGVDAPNMPKPDFPVAKQACTFMSTQIADKKLVLKYFTDGQRDDAKAFLNQMNDYAKRTWNRLDMDAKNLDGLIDAFNTGDYILYHWWNNKIETGQPFAGDIDNMIIDNVNYYPGNPNSKDVQSQPYIILVMRDMVKNAREIAKENKVSSKDIEMILPDEDTDYTSGDVGKIELDGSEKCNILLKMWKQDGEVYFSKSTKHVQIQKPKKANLKLYPIAIMNWQPRKNCCHGIAEITGLKSNLIYLNKQMALIQLHLLLTAYPKVLYDKTKIKEWSNKVASSIGVNGDIQGTASYMNPPMLPNDVWAGFEKTLSTIKDLMGVNNAALGNMTNPNNKGAFIAVREAAIFPLRSHQNRFEKMVRDVGLIWLDFFINHYPEGRMLPIDVDGETVQVPFDKVSYEDLPFDVQLEVGESQMWSELNTVYTLDNLLQQGKLTLSQYLKRMPNGYIPDKEELLQEVIAQEQQAQQLAQAQQAMIQQKQSVQEQQGGI